LVAAVDRLLRVPGLPPQVRTSLGRLLQRFDDVQHVAVDPSQIDRWQTTRLDQHYQAPMRLASVILRNLTLAHAVGSAASATFLVDMNELFQQFVADRLRRFLAPQLDLVEEPPTALATAGRLTMRPDLVMRRGRADCYVGDVKYKLATGAARMTDYYQLLAYTTAMRLPEGVLIYAQDPGDPNDPLTQVSGIVDPVHTVRIRNSTIDVHVYRLRLDGTNQELDESIERLAEWVLTRARVAELKAAA
ncbi:MAG: hypothetical protein WBF71_07630, partial [Microthrixaceae bacterium]